MKRREPKCVRQIVSVSLGGVPMKTKRRYVTRDYAARALGEKLKGDVPQRSVYNFVKEGKSPSLAVLAAVLIALKLEICPK